VNAFFKLIRGGHLFAPEDLGTKDILLAGKRIVQISSTISPPHNLAVSTYDVHGKTVIPGLVDLHVHLIGGGGESGLSSRAPEITFSNLVEAGITTVVGVLGTDSVTRRLETLLAKAQALRLEGITALMYTGSYHFPSVNLTGSVTRDIALIDQVIGVKIAISDHRSSQPSTQEIVRLASQARIGGLLGGKVGVVHMHVGEGSRGLDPLIEAVAESDIPITQFLPTHVCRTVSLLREGIEFVRHGGFIDLTAPSETLTWELDLPEILDEVLRGGIEFDHITMSSDSNGSMPKFGANGELIGFAVGEASSLYRETVKLTTAGVLPLSKALQLVSTNPAERIGLGTRKGYLHEGMDADIVVLDEGLKIDSVFANGVLVVKGGKAVARGG